MRIAFDLFSMFYKMYNLVMEIKCSYKKLVPTSQLVGHPKNSNEHPKRQIELLAKILAFQGFRHPIVVSNLSGYIVAGHGRLAAAIKAGFNEVPVDYQDFENAAQELAFLESDNLVADLARHNHGMMIDNIKDLELDSDFDLELFGIPDFELPFDDPEKEAIEDSVPTDVETRCKPGDLWILGDHRLLCGDATNIQDVDKLMNGAKADMVFTDPPYGVNYTKKTKEILKSKEYTEIKNDDKTGDELKDFFRSLFSSLFTALHKKSSYYICSPQGGDSELMMMMMRESGLKCRHQIIWVKDAPVFSMGRLDYDYKHEPILYGWVDSHEFKRKGSQDKSVWEFSRTENKLHPTMKPVELVENAILNSTDKNQKVIDVCGGSGSTLIACEKTNRKCYMMELDPHYCDVILKRWENYTGETAKILNT